MSSVPLRFLHAAGLWLDHPLAGTGPLPDELRRIAEEATLNAFDRLIDVAIERQVDFVLLVGDTFDEHDDSLRAAAALVDGCARLAEQHIRVFVLPGRADPAIAWQTLGELPENVTKLLAHDDDSVAVLRDDQLAATISRVNLAPSANGNGLYGGRSELSQSRPFTIGLLRLDRASAGAHEAEPDAASEPDPANDNASRHDPDAALRGLPFHYLALGGGGGGRRTLRTPSGIAHHPGTLQGMHRAQTGQHGFTLVEVDEAGALRQQFIPAAPVRWEEFSLPDDAISSRERLVESMRRELAACRYEPGEQLWIVRWTGTARGPLAKSLSDAAFLSELWLDVESAAGIAIPMRHTFRLLPGGPAANANAGNDSPLDFGRFHAEIGPPTLDQISALCRLDHGEPAADARLRSLVPHLDLRAINSEAARLGSMMFSQA
jgi:DNA repair exonuclease SbcCD nuclease subunit